MQFIENRNKGINCFNPPLFFYFWGYSKNSFIFDIDPKLFYPRNIGSIIFPHINHLFIITI